MITERDVLLQIINDDPNGIHGLFHRHSALFREGLIRFFGKADSEEAEPLARVIKAVKSELKEGRFDDLAETFYNWIVRTTWNSLMAQRMEQAGGEHVEPDLLYQSSDRLNEAALPEEVRQPLRDHLESCALCRELLEKCRAIPLEVRHAGAPCPEDFDIVKARVIELA